MRKIILTLLISIVAIVGVALCACGCTGSGGNGVEDGQVSAGGNYVGNNAAKLEILNAKDLHVVISTAKESIVNDAYVVEDGIKKAAQLDLSKVSFESAGEYEIKYYYGQSEVLKKAYVYGQPSIDGDASVSTTYSKAQKNVLSNIVAKDSFGNDLYVQILNDGGMFDVDGSFNVGSFNVEVAAVDGAGQVVKFFRTVNIASERNPSISSYYYFDVNENGLIVTLDSADLNCFAGISVAGIVVSPDYLDISDKVITVKNQFFYDYLLSENLVSDLINGDVYDINVLTVKGKSTASLYLTDKQSVQFDRTKINEFGDEIHPCFTDIDIAKISLTNKYQNVTPVYTMIKDGERKGVSNNVFSFDSEGTWVLEVDLRGEKITQTFGVYYDLGLENGSIFGEDNAFTAKLPSGYTLRGYQVTLHGQSDAVLLKCNSLSDVSEFANDINNLNTKNVYDISVWAEKNGKVYKQTTNFTVVKGGIGVLSSKADAVDLAPTSSSKVAFTYTQKQVGGRRGVYSYKSATGKNLAYETATIAFSSDVMAQMKDDCYLQFDIYYTNGAQLYVDIGGNRIYLYSTQTPLTDNPNVKFYKESGEEIDFSKKNPSTNMLYQPLIDFKNQWITVELKITEQNLNKVSALSGIFTYRPIIEQEVYFSNFRVSSASLMKDTTVVSVLPQENVGNFDDIWN